MTSMRKTIVVSTAAVKAIPIVKKEGTREVPFFPTRKMKRETKSARNVIAHAKLINDSRDCEPTHQPDEEPVHPSRLFGSHYSTHRRACRKDETSVGQGKAGVQDFGDGAVKGVA
jgi:hypothetical protein